MPESFDAKSSNSNMIDDWAMSGKNSILSRDEVSFNYKGSPLKQVMSEKVSSRPSLLQTFKNKIQQLMQITDVLQ